MKLVKPKLSYIEKQSWHVCDIQQEVRDVHIDHDSQQKLSFYQMTFDGCLFENVHFQNIHLEKIDFIDVIFDHCDLSNQVLEGQFLQRVVFKNCKLTGTSFIHSRLKDVEFDGCL